MFELTDFDAEREQAEQRRLSGRDKVFNYEEHEAAVSEAVSAAREEAFAQGKAEGIAEANASIESQIADVLEKMMPEMGQIVSDLGAHRQALESNVIDFMAEVARITLPSAFQAIAQPHIEETARVYMGRFLSQGKIVLTVSESMKDAISQVFEAEISRGDLEVRGDPQNASPADLSVAWHNGYREHKASDVSEKILNILTNERGKHDG